MRSVLLIREKIYLKQHNAALYSLERKNRTINNIITGIDMKIAAVGYFIGRK